MAWPNIGNYNQAILNPETSLVDTDLRRGTPATGPVGKGRRPHLWPGGLAVVYKISNGSKQYAVKCFTKPVPKNLERRYNLLSHQLKNLQLPSLVGFGYSRDGIFIKGKFNGVFPIVKMDWVSGLELQDYVEEYRFQSKSLRNLARDWLTLVSRLRSAGIAHGDFQHGNILVADDGQIRLVDYDGMFVPALSDEPPEETGHPNFRHPQRSLQDYNEHMDNFSALVIYLSLLAVAAEPRKLWDYHNENNLIFDKKDFISPGQTDIWRHLNNSSDPEVRRLTGLLKNYCFGSMASVPGLEEVVLSGAQRIFRAIWPGRQGQSRVDIVEPKTPVTRLSPGIFEKRKKKFVKARESKKTSRVLICRNGHVIKEADLHCEECRKISRKDQDCWIYGPRIAPCCGREIPDKSPYCPFCGELTGW
jgi:serine/threonine protein kinase